jgi:hypothetical protein
MRRGTLVVALALAVTMAVAPASTYTTGTVDRGSNLAVASDQNAVLAVETPDASGSSPSGELVTVTNRFDVTQTVTVRLETKENEYDLSTPRTDLSGRPDSVRVTLAPGESVQVDYEGNGQPKGDARFTVETSGPVSATLPGRVRQIDEPGNGNGNNGNGNGGGSGNGNTGDGPGNACDAPGKGPKRCR